MYRKDLIEENKKMSCAPGHYKVINKLSKKNCGGESQAGLEMDER